MIWGGNHEEQEGRVEEGEGGGGVRGHSRYLSDNLEGRLVADVAG